MNGRPGGELWAVPFPIKLPQIPDHLTEASAARRLAEQYGHRLRYDHRRCCWFVWSGHHWRRDTDGTVYRLALDAIKLWQHEALGIADAIRQKTVLDWALGFERRARLEAMLALARNLPPIATDGERWDRDPFLLGCPNGVLDLRTGDLRDGRPEDDITMQVAVPFDPSAACPRWEQCIREWFPDSDLADYVWRALGYTITGIASEQVFFAAHNPGAGGKTTMLRAVSYVLGEYSTETPFATFELHQRTAIPNDLAALAGRRMISASETNDGTRVNEARIKSFTGGDLVTARFLHGEFFSFQPVGKLWLAFNHKPTVKDDSHGFWRRVRLIPFVNTFRPDPTLADTLKREAPGILAWLVRGCLEWQVRGLGAASLVTEATDEYRIDSDHFGQFVEQACEYDEHAEVGGADLFAHYQAWAARAGHGPREQLTSTAFGRKAGERFRKCRTRDGAVYLGIARR